MLNASTVIQKLINGDSDVRRAVRHHERQRAARKQRRGSSPY
jgi:hypothetical protein